MNDSIDSPAFSQFVHQYNHWQPNNIDIFQPSFTPILGKLALLPYSGNTPLLQSVTLTNYPNLTNLTIPSHCFSYVRIFRLKSLPSLQSVSISSHSFSHPYQPNYQTMLEITDCEELESIVLEENTFQGYRAYQFENLPRLRLCTIGSVTNISMNFCNTRNCEFQSMFIIHYSFIYYRSPVFRRIGRWNLQFFHSIFIISYQYSFTSSFYYHHQ